MRDWLQLIDKRAAIAEQFPSLKKVRRERPGGRLARALDEEHAKRAARFHHRSTAAHAVADLIDELDWESLPVALRKRRGEVPVEYQDSSVSGGSFVLEEGMK